MKIKSWFMPKGAITPWDGKTATVLLYSLVGTAALAMMAYLLQGVVNVELMVPLIGIGALFGLVVALTYASRRAYYGPVAMVAVAGLAYGLASVVGNYDVVQMITSLGVLIGALPMAAVIMVVVDAHKAYRTHVAKGKSSVWQVSMLTMALVGSVISVGAAVFMVLIMLSVRACELSGSSKCM